MSAIPTGRWFRFSEYVVSNGRIAPAPGARLEHYDPLRCTHSRPSAWAAEALYGSLLDLARQLKTDPPMAALSSEGVTFRLSARSESCLRKWCRENGLLGILPLRLAIAAKFQQAVQMVAGDGADQTQAWEEGKLDNDRMLRPYWQVWKALRDDLRADPVKAKTLAAYRELVSAVSTEGLVSHLRRELGIFMLDSAEPQQLRATESSFFGEGYSEPLESFVSYAWRFRDNIQALARYSDHVRDKDESAVSRLQEAAAYLSVVGDAGSRHWELSADARSLSSVELAPSLLSYYARIFLVDHEQGRLFLECENCRRLVLVDDPRAKYCSPKCRNTRLVRNYRNRKLSQKNPGNANE